MAEQPQHIVSVDDANSAIAAAIHDAIEQDGGGQWRFPWHGQASRPTNAFTGRPFRGQNVLSLWAAARKRKLTRMLWASPNAWKGKGGRIAPGAPGTEILVPVYDEKPAGSWTPDRLAKGMRQEEIGGDAEGGSVSRLIGFKRDTWYNIAEVEGLDFAPPQPPSPAIVIAEAELVIKAYLAAKGPALVHGGLSAHWNPGTDRITMPPRSSFTGSEAFSGDHHYYATLLHECGHSTGSRGRLKRQSLRLYDKSKEYRAAEELVAELTAAFAGAAIGLAAELRRDHTAYIGTWLGILRGGKGRTKTSFGWCVARADEAAKLILSKSRRE